MDDRRLNHRRRRGGRPPAGGAEALFRRRVAELSCVFAGEVRRMRRELSRRSDGLDPKAFSQAVADLTRLAQAAERLEKLVSAAQEARPDITGTLAELVMDSTAPSPRRDVRRQGRRRRGNGRRPAAEPRTPGHAVTEKGDQPQMDAD
jgi:hypothetical protein